VGNFFFLPSGKKHTFRSLSGQAGGDACARTAAQPPEMVLGPSHAQMAYENTSCARAAVLVQLFHAGADVAHGAVLSLGRAFGGCALVCVSCGEAGCGGAVSALSFAGPTLRGGANFFACHWTVDGSTGGA